MSLLDKTWFGGGVEKFFGSQSFVRARIVDPLTSHMAAESVTNVAPVHMDVIYACLKRFGPLGKDGIAKQTGLTNSQIARRLPEMQKLGMIGLTGKTVASNSGRQEREWIKEGKSGKFMGLAVSPKDGQPPATKSTPSDLKNDDIPF